MYGYQERKQHWRGHLPTPARLPLVPQDMYSNPQTIENRHPTLLALIDAVYPHDVCFVCNNTLESGDRQHIKRHPPRFRCLYPRCQRTYRSRPALHFHLTHAHLIDQKHVDPSDPWYLLYAPVPDNYSHSSTNALHGFIPTRRGRPPKNRHENDPIAHAVAAAAARAASPAPTNVTNAAANATNATNTATIAANSSNSSNSVNSAPNSINSAPNSINAAANATNMAPTTPRNLLDASDTPTDSVASPTPSNSPFVPIAIAPNADGTVPSIQDARSPANLSTNSTSSKRSQALKPQARSTLIHYYPPLQCPICQQEFKRRNDVHAHLQAQHTDQDWYKCYFGDCSHTRSFSSREGLIYHLIRVHHCGIDDPDNPDSPMSNE
ncbi:hypothetical protein BC940DRAFT_308586 [Gongronella butleri]|nr:hypothetical protein BC940DRAFT_308586 [Gongronella butleri]